MSSYGPVGVGLFCTLMCSPMREARMTEAPPYLKDHYWPSGCWVPDSRSPYHAHGHAHYAPIGKLDKSTARRQLKSPGHYLVDPYTWPWSPNGHGHGHEWPTATPFVQCQSARPFWDTAISKFDHENPWSRSCVWSKVKVTFDLENSKVKVMVTVKPIGHIWGLEFNQYVCFLFRGNRTIFGWDKANSILDLEN